ncbi:MAG: hypothetical protein ABL883_00145 [Terricaulis sp.]
MEFLILFGAQLAALAAGFVFLVRKMDRLQQEVAQLRHALEGRRAARPKLVATNANAGHVSVDAPRARVAQVWRTPEAPRSIRIGAKALWALTAALGGAPGCAIFFGAEPAIAVICGIAVGALALLAALRPAFRILAWGGAVCSATWALAGMLTGAAQADPVIFSTVAAAAGFAGLVFAVFDRPGPGAAMMLAMGAPCLVLAAQLGMIGAPGGAFGALVVGAAISGASRLRLEVLHIGAFVAALGGLYVLSGQAAAALWFTPIATWAGALFLAVAVVRAPQLGPRGITIAGTGALAPLASIAVLHGVGQGLSDPAAASGALFSLAVILAGIAWLAAERREGNFASLKLAAWVLSAGIGSALFAAIWVIASPTPAVMLLMFASAAMAILNTRFPSAHWRVGAVLFGLAACAYAWICGAGVLGEGLPGWPTLATALALPATLALGASQAFGRNHPVSGAIMDLLGSALGLAALHIGARLVLSGGAPMSYEFGIEELSAQTCIWLAAALVLGATDRNVVRTALSRLFAALGLGAAVCLGGAWLIAYLDAPTETLGRFNALIFAAPAVLLGAHWLIWRRKHSPLLARASLGAGAVLAAAGFSAEVLRARVGASLDDWVGVAGAATAFSLALAVNFAPGAGGVRRPRWVRAQRRAV